MRISEAPWSYLETFQLLEKVRSVVSCPLGALPHDCTGYVGAGVGGTAG